MPQTVDLLNFFLNGLDPAQWPKLTCTQLGHLDLQDAGLRLPSRRDILFEDNGQIRSFDDTHRLVFDRSHTFIATAQSGASGGDTGVAGALAINIGVSEARGEIAPNSTVTITDGGNVSFGAENFVTNVAEAKAMQTDATKTGVGASVALNIGVTHTKAWLSDESTLAGAHDLKLSAASANRAARFPTAPCGSARPGVTPHAGLFLSGAVACQLDDKSPSLGEARCQAVPAVNVSTTSMMRGALKFLSPPNKSRPVSLRTRPKPPPPLWNRKLRPVDWTSAMTMVK